VVALVSEDRHRDGLDGGDREPSSEAQRPASGSGGDVTLQVRLQIMSTEHWSLLASRGLAWNESFTRAGMFLSTLSFALVALALVGQATGFGEEFRVFALIVLPVVLFLGIATSLRMDSANHHDVQCVIGMNRIRAGYLEIAPDLERFFVMGTSDDMEGITRTMAVVPHRSFLMNFLGASPTLLMVLNGFIVASIGALVVLQFGGSMAVAVAVGGGAFFVTVAGWSLSSKRMLDNLIRDYRPIFPGRRLD
jgi:hypothetical protein